MSHTIPINPENIVSQKYIQNSKFHIKQCSEFKIVTKLSN